MRTDRKKDRKATTGIGVAALAVLAAVVCCAAPALALGTGIAIAGTLTSNAGVVGIGALVLFGTVAYVSWRRRHSPTDCCTPSSDKEHSGSE